MIAVINGDRIECGKCRSLLAKKIQGYIAVREGNEATARLEIKCKARKNGGTCNEINQIKL